MKYYVGIDLHSNNSYVAVIDETGAVKYQQRLGNDSSTIIGSLKAFGTDIVGVAVESTFNWYWLVDSLKEDGFKVYLANPGAMQQYEGLKHSDDKSDAIWLANTLRLGILPTGYIYPKEERPLRDLLRKRMVLVQHRTALLIGIKGVIHNWTGEQLSRRAIKNIDEEQIKTLFKEPLNQDSVRKLHEVVTVIDDKIMEIECTVQSMIGTKAAYVQLRSVWGIGEILASTIMLETGDIRRFADAGHYASYCRGVGSQRVSNERRKGAGNKRNGNKYLAWAYLEAAQFMRRFYPQARAWYDKKAALKGRIVAIKALSHKISKACYFIMRDQSVFEPSKMFG